MKRPSRWGFVKKELNIFGVSISFLIMRLGQLARKLSIRPSQIVDFLATRLEFPEEGSNAKLSDELTEQIILFFAPDRLKEIIETDEITLEEKVDVDAQSESKIEEVLQPSIETPSIETEKQEIEIAPLGKPELIKAPKVELSGLKVVGKIELKEPKKKEPVEASEGVSSTEEKPQTVQRKKKQPRERKPSEDRPWRNPIQMQREREAREAEAKRKQEAEVEKEKRTQNYLKRIKAAPPKPIKIVEEHLEEVMEEPIKAKPKTWFGKFLYWLNH